MDRAVVIDAFLRALHERRKVELADHEAIATTVDAWREEVRTKWPELRLDELAFVAHVAARIDEQRELRECLAEVHAGDLYLAFGCSTGDPRALLAFEREHLGQVDFAWQRIRGHNLLIEDARQLVREKLLVPDGGPSKIAAYGGRGALRNWVRVTATRLLTDIAKRQRADVLPGEDFFAALPARGNDPEIELAKQTYRFEFRQALAEAAAALSSHDRNVLRYAYADGLSSHEIASIYGIHHATAARHVTRARETLVKRLREALTERIRLRGRDLESLLLLIESQVDMTMRRFLGSSS